MKFRGMATVISSWRWVLAAPAAACLCASALAATPAQTPVDNLARASYQFGGLFGSQTEVDSGVQTFIVQELTDVSLQYQGSSPLLVSSPSQALVLEYQLSHLGNGNELYQLLFENLTGDEFDALDPTIYLDDGDGLFDANVDAVYSDGQQLAFVQDQSALLFVQLGVPAGQAINDVANVRLTATAVTPRNAVGQPGASIDGAGDGGTDLVLGSNGAQQSVELPLVVSDNATLTLNKSVLEIVDPNGGDRPLPGAVITYQIEVVLAGEGQFQNLVIVDAIPDNTDYNPNSLRLNGQAQSDDEDADAANFDATNNQVRFVLGNLVAPGTNPVIEFKVTIR